MKTRGKLTRTHHIFSHGQVERVYLVATTPYMHALYLPPSAIALHGLAMGPVWGGMRPTALPCEPEDAWERRRFRSNDSIRLRGGGGAQDWVPPAFQRLPLATRWMIAAQCILFVLSHLVPAHPILGAGGGAVGSLGLNTVRQFHMHAYTHLYMRVHTCLVPIIDIFYVS